jgi:hypothetical protein
MADQHEDVINWDEAMQQVGEDEDFLRELLNDLRGELESQVAAIAAIIQVRADERKPPQRKRIPPRHFNPRRSLFRWQML